MARKGCRSGFGWHWSISDAEQIVAALELSLLMSEFSRKQRISVLWENGFERDRLDWVAVESSVFTSAAYEADNRQLYLRFHSGDIYRYFDFPPEQYEEFLAADSKGRYFGHKIRDRFHYELVYRSYRAAS